MKECYYCHKEVEPKVKICPHCGKSYPLGRSWFLDPIIIVAWVVCSAEGIWLSHSYTKLPDSLSILLMPLGVALLFYLLLKLGVFTG
jgi:hypothetical protein